MQAEAAPVQESPAVRIVFYCKDCRRLIEGIKVGRKYVYKCPQCHTKNVAFGTEKSIRGFYHVVDRPVEPRPLPANLVVRPAQPQLVNKPQ